MESGRWTASSLEWLWDRWRRLAEKVAAQPCAEACYPLDELTEVPVGEVVVVPRWVPLTVGEAA